MSPSLIALLLPLAAQAQLHEGNADFTQTCHQRYALVVDDVVVGHLAAVGVGCTSQPEGFPSGTESWWWSGSPWPESFSMMPTSTGPAHNAHTWEEHPVERFDLSRSEGFPSVSIGPTDAFYGVWADQALVAYFWLQDGEPRAQEWYGVEGVLTDELVGIGASSILFAGAEPPQEGALQVHTLSVQQDEIPDSADDIVLQ